MKASGQLSRRRAASAKGLAAFGLTFTADGNGGLYRTIRAGKGATIYTVGYERRSGDDLIALLLDAGVKHLADIRDKPVSRKPDFRAASLKSLCEEAGIEYGAWPELGSIEAQRDRLKETGDLAQFHKTFRAYACRSLREHIVRLAKECKRTSVALMCYERAHDECHRSTVADLVADELGASVVAIV